MATIRRLTATKWTLVAIGAFVVAVGANPSLPFRARGGEAPAAVQASSSAGGAVSAGGTSALNPAMQTDRRLLLPSTRVELVESLRGLPPERFTVITGTDDDSRDVGLAIFDDLKRAGWTPVSTKRLDGGAPGIAANPRRPQRRGVTAYMKRPSATIDRFLEWLPSAGLQPKLAGVIVQEDWPENVRIEVGDPP